MKPLTFFESYKRLVFRHIRNVPHLPYYAILGIDVIAVSFVFLLSIIVFESLSPGLFSGVQILEWLVVSFMVLLIFMSLKLTYRSVIRFTSLYEIYSLFFVFISTFILVLFLDLINSFFSVLNDMPKIFIFFGLFGSFFTLVFYRILVKEIFGKVSKVTNKRKNIIIYGVGENALMVYELLKKDKINSNSVIAFFDNDKSKFRKRLFGVEIFFGDVLLQSLLSEGQVDEVIVADQKFTSDEKTHLFTICAEFKVPIKFLPNLKTFKQQEFKISDLRDINLEELLGRDPINLEQPHLNQLFFNKSVLVSGAAGSIGSEIVRLISRFKVKNLILLDYAESPLYDIQQEILVLRPNTKLSVVLCDIRKRELVMGVFEKYHPDFVFHAAAYKHVPLMESYPKEAVKTNVFGTINLADAATKYGVSKFIFISTDKAVNPTNVMGATKRISEKYIQSKFYSLNHKSPTQFITTRFGNVLGSNGSVIPLFMKQIKAGGPLSLTHSGIERFFMTIPEACSLVLEASLMGKGGEIFVFDMGKPVKIYDLALNLIRLNGKVPYEDIDIRITGLRPGEKLFEELIGRQEIFKDTHHKKIFIVQCEINDFTGICESIKRMKTLLGPKTINDELILVLKEILPEYKSQESPYSYLDN